MGGVTTRHKPRGETQCYVGHSCEWFSLASIDRQTLITRLACVDSDSSVQSGGHAGISSKNPTADGPLPNSGQRKMSFNMTVSLAARGAFRFRRAERVETEADDRAPTMVCTGGIIAAFLCVCGVVCGCVCG